MRSTFRSRTSLGIVPGAVACVLILSVFGVAWWLEQRSSDLYYLAVQEDEALEWATAWAFLIAAVVGLFSAAKSWRTSHRVEWFLLAVSGFCLVVGMEEISWGQRILGYRPPDYFLSHNFQQEVNVHNVVSTDLRKLAMKIVLLGYGALLPLLAAPRFGAKLLSKLRVFTPPLSLVPGFLAALWFYQAYPWTHSGEWVEMMLGLGFLYAMAAAYLGIRSEALAAPVATTSDRGQRPRSRKTTSRLLTVSALTALVVGLGFANAALTRAQLSSNQALIDTAKIETEALRRDFASGRAGSNCNLHKRLYAFVKQYHQGGLRRGAFAALESQGMPESRAEFFLDPWNSPYWIRDRCSKSRGKRLTFVYSFGPNRKRDSTRYEMLGDDVGAWIRQRALD